MKTSRAYQIPFIGLKVGVHVFRFEMNRMFFEAIQQQLEADVVIPEEVWNSRFEVEVKLDKKMSFMTLFVTVQGHLQVDCDRCSAPIALQALDEFTMYVKFVEDPAVMPTEDDVMYLSKQETHLDLLMLLYELIVLSIPFQKVCDPFQLPKPCNMSVLARLTAEETPKDDNASLDSEETPIDPRWEALKKLKNR